MRKLHAFNKLHCNDKEDDMNWSRNIVQEIGIILQIVSLVQLEVLNDVVVSILFKVCNAKFVVDWRANFVSI